MSGKHEIGNRHREEKGVQNDEWKRNQKVGNHHDEEEGEEKGDAHDAPTRRQKVGNCHHEKGDQNDVLMKTQKVGNCHHEKKGDQIDMLTRRHLVGNCHSEKTGEQKDTMTGKKELTDGSSMNLLNKKSTALVNWSETYDAVRASYMTSRISPKPTHLRQSWSLVTF